MINYVLDPGAFDPERAHKEDAGWDLKTPRTFILFGHSSIAINTGVHIEIPKGCVGFVKSKSGLYFNKGITTDGTVDAGYTGANRVKLYNHSDSDVMFEAGDKIAQIVIQPIITDDMEQVKELKSTERGSGGFGSTGR